MIKSKMLNISLTYKTKSNVSEQIKTTISNMLKTDEFDTYMSIITKETTINNYIYEEDEELKQETRLHPGTRIIFEIDKELSNKLIKGVYTCTLILYDKDNSYVDTLFSQTDGNLIVK